ncbi:zinc finger SWIM domain-containing protein 3-like [Paramacrobiotus metropolitanus]|uniref:zinc finger SWIM domain-containing protein 3-like n=1 Tax=Paramacrobiotus metropolitanus TaxID=2943436 RepID=UPI0024456399|nr:zinc finger SWIM domain-containing protein 3-like [Paramacrobiotus metropolitanus]
MMKEGDLFDNYDDELRALKKYEAETFQLFVVASGHSKLSPDDPLHESLKYSSMKLVCKHAGNYRGHRKESVVSTRKTQATFKTGCNAYVKFKLFGDKVTVLKLPGVNDHNHAVEKSLYHFYPENRNLSDAEKIDVDYLVQCNVQRSTICKSVNEKRRSSGACGQAITKDIHNYVHSTNSRLRNGITHGENLKAYLQELVNLNPETDIRLVKQKDESGNNMLQMLYIQTAEMKKLLFDHTETIFMDSTYRINCEHYCLYSVVVEDANGFGQPVLLAFLANEKRQTLVSMFELLIQTNRDAVQQIRCIFIDKDFTQIGVLKDLFPTSDLLLCCFHALKSFKAKIASEALPVATKTDILHQFKRVMYAYDDEALAVEEENLKTKLTQKLAQYYSKNWENSKQFWAHAYRKHLPTRGNRTINRIERWFLMVKSAFRYSGRAVWTRYHLKECVEIIIGVTLQKWSIASYNEYVNASKRLIIHDFPISEYAEAVGRDLTKIAAKVVEKQFSMYLVETYSVETGGPSEWIVKVEGTPCREYEIQKADISFCCTCFINCAFGLPCRHIFSVRGMLKKPLFSMDDVIAKWRRAVTSADTTDLHPDVLKAALQGKTDGFLMDTEQLSPERPAHSTLGQRYKASKDVCKRIASVAAGFGGAQFGCILSYFNKLEQELLCSRLPEIQGTGNIVAEVNDRKRLLLRKEQVRQPKGRPSEGCRHKRFKRTAKTTD